MLKTLALVLSARLPASPHCYHGAGHGGANGAVRTVWEHLPAHRFVLKTDVQGLYASIEHQRLLDWLAVDIADRRVLNLCGQVLRRTAECGGHSWEARCGIALGCPRSPVMGALLLADLDAPLAQHGFPVVRCMDDILVLTPTRWKLPFGG